MTTALTGPALLVVEIVELARVLPVVHPISAAVRGDTLLSQQLVRYAVGVGQVTVFMPAMS